MSLSKNEILDILVPGLPSHHSVFPPQHFEDQDLELLEEPSLPSIDPKSLVDFGPEDIYRDVYRKFYQTLSELDQKLIRVRFSRVKNLLSHIQEQVNILNEYVEEFDQSIEKI